MATQTEAPRLSRSQLVEAASRELRMRRDVYPKRVSQKKMTKGDMTFQIAAMEKIEAILIVIRDDDAIATQIANRLEKRP